MSYELTTAAVLSADVTVAVCCVTIVTRVTR